MDGITTALVAALCIGIVTLIVALISRFLGRFNAETRRIADNMRRAQDSDEYIYWQSRLRRHYIRLLPFVSEKTAGRICSRLFRKPKHCQEKEHSDGLFHILAPSVLSVCLCAICLCGMSWAWFTATGNTSVSTIQAATYNVAVTVSPTTKAVTTEDGTTTEVASVTKNSGNNVWTVGFKENGNYTITIWQNSGTHAASKGYCIIKYDNNEYYTDQLTGSATSLSFTVVATKDSNLTVEPHWGIYTENDGKTKISNDSSIGKTSGVVTEANENSSSMQMLTSSIDMNYEAVIEEPAIVGTAGKSSKVEEEGTADESDQTQSSKEGENDEPENEAGESDDDDQAEQSNNNNSGGTQEPAASTSGSETTNEGTSENTSGNSTNTESGTSSDTGGTAAD